MSSYCLLLLTPWLLEPSFLQGTDRCFEPTGPDWSLLVISLLPARLKTFHGPVEPFLSLVRSFLSYPVVVLQGLSLRWQTCYSHHWPFPTLGSDDAHRGYSPVLDDALPFRVPIDIISLSNIEDVPIIPCDTGLDGELDIAFLQNWTSLSSPVWGWV